MWFAAHAVLYLKHLEPGQDSFTIWENVYLVEAESEEESYKKAREYATLDEDHFEGPERGTYEDDKPAEWVFAGIRKITKMNPSEVPESGLEVTYSEYRVPSLEDVEALARGESIQVEYVD